MCVFRWFIITKYLVDNGHIIVLEAKCLGGNCHGDYE